MTDPAEAYRAAKALRAGVQEVKQKQDDAAASLPDRVEAKLVPIIAAMQASLPADLTLETKIGPAGLLGPRGVKGVFFKLIESNQVVAQGSYNCRDDEVMVFTGFPPDGDKRPQKELGMMPLEKFDEQKAKSLLAQIITIYV